MTTKTLTISDAAIKRHAADPAVRQLRDQSIGHLYFRYHQSRQTGSWYLVSGRDWLRQGHWPEITAAVMRREAPGILANSEKRVETNQNLAFVLNWFRGVTEQNKTVTDQRRSDIVSVIDCQLMPATAVMQPAMNTLERHDLLHYLILPLQQRYKPSTVGKAFRILKQATKAAARVSVIGYDPLSPYRLSDLMQGKIEPKEAELRESDLEMVGSSLLNAPSHVVVFVLLMLMHGNRINETRMTAWRWVDFANAWLVIPGRYTKNRRQHRLPLTGVMLELLARYRTVSTGDYLFEGNKRPVSKSTASRWVNSVSQGEWGSHSLRKLMRTILADLGIEWWLAELLINHTPSKMDRTYIHTLVDQQSRDALEAYHTRLINHSETWSQLLTESRSENPANTSKPAPQQGHTDKMTSLQGD